MPDLSQINTDALLVYAQTFGIKLLLALATFVIGRWIAKALVAGLERAMQRAKADPTLSHFLGNVAYGIMLAIVVVSALGQLGVSTTSAAALLGGAGVAIGLSLKDQLSSFAAGVMLITFRPFRLGDFVDAGGVAGTVEEIRIIATVLRTPNNQQVTVPNAAIWGSTITNFNAKETRRIDMPIGISYTSDMRSAKDIALRLCTEDERVLADPAVWVGITDLADSAVIVSVRSWVKTSDYWQTRCDLLERIKLAYDEAGIEIPFNQLDVHLHKAEAA